MKISSRAEWICATVGRLNTSTPQSTFQRKYQFEDDFSWSLAAHDFKFGGELIRADPFGVDAPFFNQGTFYYANDGDPVDQAIEFTQFAFIPALEQPFTAYGVYAQDDWRLGKNLTLNLGVRYDVEIGTLSGLEYGENGNFLINDRRSPFFGRGTPEDDKDNVAPRLGFAWDVGGKGTTVVRGGWGLFYDKLVYLAGFFTDIDAVGIRGVDIVSPPFRPENIPPFETLFSVFGFPLPFDEIVVPGFEFPKSSQFSIGLSHQLSPTLALDVDYIHADGSQYTKPSDINERRIPFDDTSRLFYPEQRGRLRIFESIGEDRYDGLQLSFRKRFSNKAQFVVNYALSEAVGNAGDFSEEAECRPCIGDERDSGPRNNDTRHNLIASGIFQLPADFQLSALLQAESARPLTASSSQDLNGNGRRGTSAGGEGLDFTPGPNGEPPGRGNFRGDSTYIVDLRIVKFIRFGERNLQLMFEAFNIFNRVNRGRQFEPTFESPNFGKWTGSLEQGLEQFQAQLGIRFSF